MNWNLAVSWGLVPVCMAIAAAYAWLLYRKGGGLADAARWLVWSLAVSRGVLVFLILFLLLGPMVRTTRYDEVDPQLMMVVDNSASMSASAKTLQLSAQLEEDRRRLADRFDVQLVTLDPDHRPTLLDSLRFDGPHSDYALPFKRLADATDELYDAVLWYGDGLYNRGEDPVSLAARTRQQLLVVGIGDTVLRKDLRIDAIQANPTAMVGAQAAFEVDLSAVECPAESFRMQVRVNGELQLEEDGRVDGSDWFQERSLRLRIPNEGSNRVEVQVSSLDGERNIQNNRREFYIQGVLQRQNVELWTRSVHPDVGSWRSLLETRDNYSVNLVRDGFSVGDQDLVILFDWFRRAADLPLFEQLRSKGVPVLIQIGPEVNARLFAQASIQLGLERLGAGSNHVQSVLNPSFDLFHVSEELGAGMVEWPPLRVAFGKFRNFGRSDVLSYQRLGTITTEDPLILLRSEQGYRYGVLAGTGLWGWRLDDFRLHGTHDRLTRLLGQMVQFVSERRGADRLRLTVGRPLLYTGERQLLRAFLLDRNGVLVKNDGLLLRITGPKGTEQERVMPFTGRSNDLELSGFSEPGRYTLELEVEQGGEQLRAKASFRWSEQDLEALRDRADFDVLRRMAQVSEGEFATWPMRTGLIDRLMADPAYAPSLRSERDWHSALEWQLLFWLLLVLLTVEWAVRKFIGSY